MPHIETLLAQSGCEEDPGTGALVAPIHLSTTFIRDADGTYPRGFSYSRDNNPTRRQFEETLAQIEGGDICSAFSSGMAAVMTVFQSLKPGDHVILPDDVYHGVRHLAHSIFQDWGLEFSLVDLSDLEALKAALRTSTALIWIETPSNPLLKITDIAGVVDCARTVDAQVLVDGAWTTPLLQKPLELGATLVLHSVTKYLAGHSDVLGGAIIGHQSNPFMDRIQQIQKAGGAVMDPFSAWLSLRGMRSLSARIKLQCENARRIAAFLNDHHLIDVVHHPSLATHPGHDIASKQMSDFGAMISIEVDGSAEFAKAIANNTNIFKQATSLGGTESLIEHRASIEAQPTKTPQTLLRLSVGLENINDLLADLEQAISKSVNR